MAQASSEARLGLEPGRRLSGFVLEHVEPLPEIEGTAYVFRHEASGTPLMWLANDDENKSFSIAFKTPPADDTGVFHILEHSVLCGSDRYPVKEPFVSLLKTSMQTFLNALTFPDKTMYPVASTNERDLLNLMDVYLDAVFHPLLYRKRQVFEQEGWHYELEEDEEGQGRRLACNGVVLNEMRGALADPDEAVLDGLSAALFPDTCYRFESGGDPTAIPTLSYEAYLDAHARHYSAGNARVVLYGDISLEPELDLVGGRYLSEAPRPAGGPNPLLLQEPVRDLEARRVMATSPENRCVACGYVLGTFRDRARVLAAKVLADALMGSNEAPLKRELLSLGLGTDVDAFVCDELLQPYLVVELRGAREGAARDFREALDAAFARYAREGVPRENLEASLAAVEFSLRERDFGYADGVALAISSMGSWLYDDGMPCDYVRYEDAVARLRAGLEDGSWERLVRDALVDNPHRACCELVPVEEGSQDDPSVAEDARLQELLEGLSPEELARIEDEAALLRRAQDEPDPPEAVASLPRLAVSDIGPARPDPAFGLDESAPLPCLYHEAPTRRIDYAYHYFDMSCLSWDELGYAVLASSLLGKMGTSRHSAAEVDRLVEARLGRLSFAPVVHVDSVTGEATPRIAVGSSALSENVADLATLPSEVWGSTDFSDTTRIRTVLQQQRIDSEQAFLGSGSSYALSRAWGYTSKAGYLAQHLGNVDYYRFVRELLDSWDERAPQLPAILSDVCRRVFRRGGDLHSFTGERADMARFWEAAGDLGLPQGRPFERRLLVPEPPRRNEAFVIPSDVCFAAKADSAAHAGSTYSGLWPIAARALDYDYLWNEVRVKGGAYGVGLRAATTGDIGMYTFRDPRLDESLDRLDRAGAWLRSWDPAPEDMEGYIVSAVAAHDAPERARAIAQRQDASYLARREPSWREAVRGQELAATPEAVRTLAAPLERLAERDAVCVFGSRDIIERSRRDFEVVDLLS